ncbi:MAG: GatB/YqeY domain-containing protein [Chloroflexi bacterium]|nr:GatB/YqeY domain-containing protein [Chloroflexota bacterium]
MSPVEKLRDDLNRSLRKGDKARVSTIRLLLANIQYAEIAKRGSLDEADLLGVIAKQARQHRESIEAFRQGNRADLVTKEETELAIVEEYLPKQMSRDDIAVAARQAMADVGAKGPGDKGKVMGKLMPQMRGKAEGTEVNSVVSELLAKL